MKTLENCTLLQACEYLAFGWKPLSDDDELMLQNERKRPYIKSNSGDLTNALYKLKRAKQQLLKLFDNGVNCYYAGRALALPTDKVKNTINILIGVEHNNTKIGLEIIDNTTNETDFYSNITINFMNLQSRLRKFTQKIAEPYITYELEKMFGGFYFLPDTVTMVKLRTIKPNSKIDTLLNIVIEFPYRTFTRKEMAEEWPENAKAKFNPEKDRFDNLLKMSSLPPDIVQAFFPILTSDKIKFTKYITNFDLERIGIEDLHLSATKDKK